MSWRRGCTVTHTTLSEYDVLVRQSVEECVQRQAQCGVDIVGDGEVSKPGFYTYVRSRIAGFEPRPDEKMPFFEAEVAAFPEYYERYFAEAMTGGAVAPVVPLVCTGPVRYCGQEQLQVDIDNLVTAKAGATHRRVHARGRTERRRSQRVLRDRGGVLHAVGEALAVEYRAIVAAGFVLQIDDPFLTEIFVDPTLDHGGRHRRAAMLRRSGQRQPRRDSSRAGALAHLLRHQRGTADPRSSDA